MEKEKNVIAYYSKTLHQAESNNPAAEGEALTVVMAVAHFQPYSYGKACQLQTDQYQAQGQRIIVTPKISSLRVWSRIQ